MTCVQILDGVTRLASVYSKICAAGCTLFQNFRAVFYCDPTNPVCMRMEFSKDAKYSMLGRNVRAKGMQLLDLRYLVVGYWMKI